MHIAIDLDGTLAEYSGYKGPQHIGEPYLETVNWIMKLNEYGHNLWIFTARTETNTIKDWLKFHNIEQYFKGITNIKEPFFDLFIDDRAIRFTGDYPTINQIASTKPWWK